MLQYAVFQVRKFCSNEGLRRSLAVVMGIVSASIIFSETTIATKLSNLSVFSLMIRSTAVESGSGAADPHGEADIGMAEQGGTGCGLRGWR